MSTTAHDSDKSPLLRDDRFSSFSSCTNGSIQEDGDDASATFHDVTERTSSFASILSHHRFYDVTEQTSLPASSLCNFYDSTQYGDVTAVHNSDIDVFYDVKERDSSSLSTSRNPIVANDNNNNNNSNHPDDFKNYDMTRYDVNNRREVTPLDKTSSLLASRYHHYGSLNSSNSDNIRENALNRGRATHQSVTSNLNNTSSIEPISSALVISTHRALSEVEEDENENGNGNEEQDEDNILSRAESEENRERLNRKSDEGDSSEVTATSNSARTAQLMSTLILLLYGIALVPAISLTSQYLTVRWRRESGLNLSEQVNRSVCRDAGSNGGENTTSDDEISARVSTVITYYNYVISGTSVIACLFLGSYADVIGRRVIILAPALSAVLHFIIVICIMRFDLDTKYFYASSAVIGSGGSFYSMLIGVFTVTSDVNDAKNNRVIWLALQMCVTSVTLALGNIGLGYAIKYIGFYQAAIMLEAFAIAAFIVALFFMPETLPKERKYKAVSASLHPVNTIARAFRIYTSEGTGRNRKCLWLCLVLFFFSVIPDLQLYSLDTIFQLHKPLCWDSTQIGYYGAIQTGGKKLLGTILLKLLQYKGWIKIEKLAMIVCLFQAGSMVLQALLKHSWQMYIVPLIGTPSIITVPVIRGIMSFLVGRHNLGALFASIALIETVCSVVAATSINKVYIATVSYMPGAVYFLMAAFAIVSFLLFIPFFYVYEDPANNTKTRDTKGKPSA